MIAVSQELSISNELAESLEATIKKVHRLRGKGDNIIEEFQHRMPFIQGIWAMSANARKYPELDHLVVALYDIAHYPLHILGLWQDILYFYQNIGLKAAERCRQPRQYARFLTCIGVIKSNQSNPEGGLIDFRTAISILHGLSQDKKAQEDLGSCLFHACSALNDLGRYLEAITTANEAIRVCEFVGRWDTQAFALGQLGNAYLRLGKFRLAEETYNRCIEIWQNHPEQSFYVHTTYYQLGRLFIFKKHYEQAHLILQKSIDLKRQIGEEKEGLAHCAAQLGVACAHLGLLEKARENLDLADEIIIEGKLGDKRGKAEIEYGFALLEFVDGDYSQATYHLENALTSLSGGLYPDVKLQMSLLLFRIALRVGHPAKGVYALNCILEVLMERRLFVKTILNRLFNR